MSTGGAGGLVPPEDVALQIATEMVRINRQCRTITFSWPGGGFALDAAFETSNYRLIHGYMSDQEAHAALDAFLSGRPWSRYPAPSLMSLCQCTTRNHDPHCPARVVE